MKKRYLAWVLGMAIAGCNASPPSETAVPDQPPSELSSSDTENAPPSEGVVALEQTTVQERDSDTQPQAKGEKDDTLEPSPTDISQTDAPQTDAPQTDAPQTEASQAALASQEKKSPNSTQASKTSKALEESEAKIQIKVDDTVCGAGGQEAYFETRRQEIYICRNENAALTYISTPKKSGNSIFLPATAVPDGKRTAYIAQDGTSVFIVGPFGYRREENGKSVAQEKVIRKR